MILARLVSAVVGETSPLEVVNAGSGPEVAFPLSLGS